MKATAVAAAIPGAIPMMPMMPVPGMPVPPGFPQVPYVQPIPGKIFFPSKLCSWIVTNHFLYWYLSILFHYRLLLLINSRVPLIRQCLKIIPIFLKKNWSGTMCAILLSYVPVKWNNFGLIFGFCLQVHHTCHPWDFLSQCKCQAQGMFACFIYTVFIYLIMSIVRRYGLSKLLSLVISVCLFNYFSWIATAPCSGTFVN